MERLPVEHVVTVHIEDGKFLYTKNVECLCVWGGDTIKWKLRNKFPWGIVIKAPVSPLNWSYKMTGSGLEITATVLKGAQPGIYRYGIGAFDGKGLLFDDPDIIVRRPK
jgi:hypothetical protein